MSAMHAERSASSAVLRFEAKLEQHSKSANGPAGVAIAIPIAIGRKMSGLTLAEGTINGHPFRAEVERSEHGALIIRANAAMLRGAGAKAGSTVVLAILGPEPKLVIPPDLRSAFAASAEATSLWKTLAPHVQRDWIRWIDGTNVAETRARRITRTIEQLAEGKRRPCCVNFYEYSLARIDSDDIKPELRKHVKH